MESTSLRWLRCRARAAARRAFHDRFDPVAGQLEEPFEAAVQAVIDACVTEDDIVPAALVDAVVAPVVGTPGEREERDERGNWPAEELVEALTSGSAPPPLHAFVDDASGPVREENLLLSPSGAWRAVDSFVHDEIVYLVWFGDGSFGEYPYRAAYRITDPPEVAREWQERVDAWVHPDDDDDEPAWPEDWWDEPC